MEEKSNSIHTERLTLRISKTLLEEVKQKARDSEMSVSAYIRMILRKDNNYVLQRN